jgi:hypothetical protein
VEPPPAPDHLAARLETAAAAPRAVSPLRFFMSGGMMADMTQSSRTARSILSRLERRVDRLRLRCD